MRESLRRGWRGCTRENILDLEPQEAEEKEEIVVLKILKGGRDVFFCSQYSRLARADRADAAESLVGRPPKPVCRPRAREQSVLMAGQQAIEAAVIRGEEIPQGHVVREPWPKQTYAVAKPTKSWVKKSREKEAKKRHQKNKQTRTCQREKREVHNAAPKGEKKQEHAQPPKHVQRRQRVKQEQEAQRLIRHSEREKRKRGQEEHRVQKQCEREERKRERRLCAREEREQERLWRLQWHEEIKRERERRLARKQERMASLASAALATSSESSRIFPDSQTLTPLPKPP